MKIVEFFCGTKSISKAFQERKHQVFTIDNNQKFKPDFCIDILDFEVKMLPKEFRKPDVLWFSPPCTTLGPAGYPFHWKNNKEATHKAYLGQAYVMKSLEIIKELEPMFWFIENPKGQMRKLHFMRHLPKKTITYCKYGETYRKETDIFTNAIFWNPINPCKAGDKCHIGSNGSIDRTKRRRPRGCAMVGLNSEQLGKIPEKLCKELVEVTEVGFGNYSSEADASSFLPLRSRKDLIDFNRLHSARHSVASLHSVQTVLSDSFG